MHSTFCTSFLTDLLHLEFEILASITYPIEMSAEAPDFPLGILWVFRWQLSVELTFHFHVRVCPTDVQKTYHNVVVRVMLCDGTLDAHCQRSQHANGLQGWCGTEDRSFVFWRNPITTKRERYSLAVSLPLFMSTHLIGIGFTPLIRSSAKSRRQFPKRPSP